VDEHSRSNGDGPSTHAIQRGPGSQTVLPDIPVLTFVRERSGARPVLVAVGQSASLPTGVSADGCVSGGRYCLSYAAPSVRLQRWAHAGARFDLCRLGTPCVWLGGKLYAGIQDEPRLQRLDDDERAYLDAYLTLIDRSWSDPDVADIGL